jgi:hypothetical protein
MKKFIPFILGFILIISACHDQSEEAQKKQAYNNFLQDFPSLELPYGFNVDSLNANLPDSLQLERSEEHQLIPDSIWNVDGKKDMARIFPLGENTYGDLHLLLIKRITSSSKSAILLVFSKTDTLMAAKEVASLDRKDPQQLLTFRMDDNHLLSLHEKNFLEDGHVVTREKVYGIGPEGQFNLILTNTNEPVNPKNFYNPIDTFPQENKYSGDYTSEKAGLVSIRDGEEEGSFRFFIHLNKHNGDCTGELDGIAHFTNENIAEYKEEGGLCGIRFTFSSEKVTIKEIGGCGAYRGISCFFDGSYTKEDDK